MTKSLKPNYEALQQLVRVLRKVAKTEPPGRFQMDVFYHHNTANHSKVAGMSDATISRTPVHKLFTTNCGTSACVAGWAASDPWFIKRGLQLEVASIYGDQISAMPTYKKSTMFSALELFFRIDDNTATYIFGGSKTGKAARAARRVEYAIKVLQAGEDTQNLYRAPWR